MQAVNTVFSVLVLIMSVVAHEVAHGFAAESQGDPTARYAGRLSLNPLKHIDMIGSVLLPLFCAIFGGPIIGWAKPVPYDERNLKSPRWGTLWVASAGILTNIALAVVFGMAIRFAGILGSAAPAFVVIAGTIAYINIILALFNLIPIPPLDGSKILFSLLWSKGRKFQRTVEYLSLPLLILFLFLIWPSLSPAIGRIFTFITGLS